MLIYLCPTDKKLACSWEGQSEDILEHFEQEHDDLLHFGDTFPVDLADSSENRLLFIDEEIYLTQTKISENLLRIKLRYLGPQKLAEKINYSIVLRTKCELNQTQYLRVSPEGSIEVDLSKLQTDVTELQNLECTLHISKDFGSTSSDDGVVLDEEFQNSREEISTTVTDSPILIRTVSPEENNEIVTPPENNETVTSPETNEVVSLSENNEIVQEIVEIEQVPIVSETPKVEEPEHALMRSKTTNFEEIKRRNVKRCKSTVSLGSIQENDTALICTSCSQTLVPPVYICPCGQNFCNQCQSEICRICHEQVGSERNTHLEENYNKFLVPCKFKKLGCPQKLVYSDLHQHETYCTFCEYKCPVDECTFEGQFKGLCKHLKLIHGSTKILESFIVVFQNIPEAFLVNEERGIFYCFAQYSPDHVIWEARFCGPKERSFFCELKFKDGKLKEPLLLRKKEHLYSVQLSTAELKKLKVKAKNAILTITC